MPDVLHDWVARQARQRPAESAVVLDNQRLTYGALETLSNQLAHALREAGCRRGDRVCLMMPKSPLAVVAIVGIYKADAVYVPLDPSSPASRLAKVIRRCESGWILAGGDSAKVAALFERQQLPLSPLIGWLDPAPPVALARPAVFSLEDVLRHSSAPPVYESGRDDIAHILFTSGSTGEPKGVMITHANVIRFIEWAIDYFGIDSSDRFSGHPPLNFDLSFFDIFATLATGAQLCLVPPEASLLPNKLAEWMRISEVTQWFSVPSVLTYMAGFDVVRHNDFPRLKRLLWCGEVFPTNSLIYWMERLPHVSFTNLYGPTETTIASSYYTVPRCPPNRHTAIPIGTACEGEQLMVLDKQLQPVPAGQAGDLYIRGAGVSPGYWKDPGRTGEVFLNHPGDAGRLYKTGDLAQLGEDGLIYFLGREDSQVKSRGYRIELGEIESALSATGVLHECAVMALTSAGFDGVTVGCAYVAPPRVTPAVLRQHLKKELPAYMIPSRWMALEELPRNANGKIDRRRLRDMLPLYESTAYRHA